MKESSKERLVSIEEQVNKLMPSKTRDFLEIGEFLFEAHEQKLYKSTGHFDSFAQWVTSTRVAIGEKMAHAFKSFHKVYVRDENVDASLLRKIGIKRLEVLLSRMRDWEPNEVQKLLNRVDERKLTMRTLQALVQLGELRRILSQESLGAIAMSEKELVPWVLEHHPYIFGPNLRLFDSQGHFAQLTIDLIGQHTDSDDLVLIEVRIPADCEAVGKVLAGVNALEETRRDGQVYYKRGTRAKQAHSIECSGARGAVASTRFDRLHAFYAAKGQDLVMFKVDPGWTYTIASISMNSANRAKWDEFRTYAGSVRKDF